MNDKKAIYECESCRHCYPSVDRGERVYGMCPRGPDSWSKKVTKEYVRIPTKE